jgi:hypothetical protein
VNLFQDFESPNSFWHNEYSQIDPASLGNDKRILFTHLFETAIEKFTKFVHGYSNHSFVAQLKQLHSVHAFFEAELFKGFVLTISLNDNPSKRGSSEVLERYAFEAYFESVSRVSVIDATGKVTHFSPDQSLKNLLVQTVLKIQVRVVIIRFSNTIKTGL